MQYAQVLIDTKTINRQQAFTYTIPPEILPYLQPGVICLVPFRTKEKEAIVEKIIKRVEPDLIGRLKPIKKIIDFQPVIDETHWQLARWISDYYWCSLSEAVFTMLPTSAKRIQAKFSPEIAKTTTFSLSKSSQSFYYQGYFLERIKIYQKLIKKSLSVKKKVILLFPDFDLIQKANREIKKNIPNLNFALFHSSLTQTERYREWLKIRSNKVDLVVGTRQAIFAPLIQLGLIIIDDEDNFSYQQEQSPHYHARTVGEKLSQIIGTNLITSSEIPSLKTFYELQTGRAKKLNLINLTSPQPILVRMDNQLEIISQPLEQAIKNHLDQGSKILLFLNRKGHGVLICRDCGHLFSCPNCEHGLLVNQELYCNRCGFKTPEPSECPECHGINLIEYGWGTNRLLQKVKAFFPKVKVNIIESDSKEDFELIQQSEQAQIVIATRKILFLARKQCFGLVGIIDFDYTLSLPSYRAWEEVFIELLQIVRLGKEIIIQTHLENNLVIQTITTQKWSKFYSEELKARQSLGYPPFIKLIRLLYRHPDPIKTEGQAQDLTREIKATNFGRLNSFIMLGPSPCYFPKLSGQYRWQIILKIPHARIEIEKKLADLIPPDWTIDIDPLDLL